MVHSRIYETGVFATGSSTNQLVKHFVRENCLKTAKFVRFSCQQTSLLCKHKSKIDILTDFEPEKTTAPINVFSGSSRRKPWL
jgi:hypothetical protein